MSLKHGDKLYRNNVFPVHKYTLIQHTYYHTKLVFNHNWLEWEYVYDYTRPYTSYSKQWTNEIDYYRKLKRPVFMYRFRMDPSPTSCGHYTSYGGYRFESLVLRDYKHHHDVQMIDDIDDVIFIDTRAKLRYKNSGMTDFDGKCSSNQRTWKRTKVGKQWERKIKRKSKKQICWHDQVKNVINK